MRFADFHSCYGKPRPSTGVTLSALGLAHSRGLSEFQREVGFGVFADGLLSFGSVREEGAELCGWASWVPPEARLFGCSAFGALYLTRGEDVWVIDTQEGVVIESDFTVGELLDKLTTEELLRGSLRAAVFADWLDHGGSLPPRSVLCPAPAIALGGTWALESLAPVSLPVYLAFTSALFLPEGSAPVDLRTHGAHS